ncbi:META domain-containing protein [Salipiger sp. P9]|uniref:META domain-containing protein n=1 Tax=Salipiger pentaromativorans TaxID=2943193 RepID=UPI0021588A18|nr:META domain-containing protein [Salipiger pentaromativorans]MCR8550373.1 META domain-containing protein [Salipiger pentaromativorans]
MWMRIAGWGLALSLAGAAMADEPVGPLWQVVALDGRDAEAPVPEMRFDEAGRLAGTGGCNRYRASVGIDGGAMRIEGTMATRMFCGPAVMAQEQAFFALLAQVDGWQIAAPDRLALFAGARVVIEARRGPPALANPSDLRQDKR